MTNKILFLIMFFAAVSFFAGCHVAQEKAWEETLAITNKAISENERLSKNIDRIELERRQFIRVHIKPQTAKIGFQKITIEITKIAGEALFANPGNKLKELTVFGNLVNGDELIVCKYTKEKGVELVKDRTMLSM